MRWYGGCGGGGKIIKYLGGENELNSGVCVVREES